MNNTAPNHSHGIAMKADSAENADSGQGQKKRHQVTPDHIKEAALHLYSQGGKPEDIAANLGIGKSTVEKFVAASGIARKVMPKGRMKVIPDDLRRKILDAYAAGMTIKQIAIAFKVGRSTAGHMVSAAGIMRGNRAGRPNVHRRVQGVTIRAVPDIIRKPAENDSAPARPRYEIEATEGKLAALAEYAKAKGLTLRQAMQDWHNVRAGHPPMQRKA